MNKLCFKRTGWLAVALAAAVLGSSLAHAQMEGVITRKGESKPLAGIIVWNSRERVYEVTANKVTTTLKLDEIAKVSVKTPPAELEAASRQVRGGKPSLAIPALKDIFDRYEMLQYDSIAGRLLAEAYVKNGQAKESLAICEKLARNNLDALTDPELAGSYMEALLALDQVGKLEELLGSIIAKGSRESQAVALIRRGDLKMKRGNHKDALIDGYLRAIVLYEDIKQTQPEALYKAAQCFDQLRQEPYAERMRQTLRKNYPQDSYALKINAGK